MVRRILLIAAVLVMSVYGVAEAAKGGSNATNPTARGAGNGVGQGTDGTGNTGEGEENPNSQGGNNGANPDNNPGGTGCQPANKPPKGEQPAINNPQCPTYNGNDETTFQITSGSNIIPLAGGPLGVWGGWCGNGGTAKFSIDTSAPTAAQVFATLKVGQITPTTFINRTFQGTITLPAATAGAHTLWANCSNMPARSIALVYSA